MTHSTPIAATSATPPPHGKGLGVGGGLLAILAALALLPSTVSAQIIPTGTPAADILLSHAIAEQRVFLTCTALDSQTHGFLADLWAKDVSAAAAILTAAGTPAEAIAAFTTAAAVETLLPAPDTPFQDVQQFCASQPDWVDTLNRMQMLRLETSLPGAFE